MKDDEAHERLDALEGQMHAIRGRLDSFEHVGPTLKHVVKVLGNPSSPLLKQEASGLCKVAEDLLAIEAEKKRERDALKARQDADAQKKKDEADAAKAKRDARNAWLTTASKVLALTLGGGGFVLGAARYLMSLKGVHLP